MSENTNSLLTEIKTFPTPRWLAGARYPSGTEIWCATRSGDPAWTPDPRRASIYPSEGCAEMAARLLADGDAVPFWAPHTA